MIVPVSVELRGEEDLEVRLVPDRVPADVGVARMPARVAIGDGPAERRQVGGTAWARRWGRCRRSPSAGVPQIVIITWIPCRWAFRTSSSRSRKLYAGSNESPATLGRCGASARQSAIVRITEAWAAPAFAIAVGRSRAPAERRIVVEPDRHARGGRSGRCQDDGDDPDQQRRQGDRRRAAEARRRGGRGGRSAPPDWHPNHPSEVRSRAPAPARRG